MSNKLSSKLSFLIIGVEGIIFSLILVSFFVPVQISQANSGSVNNKVSSIIPARISIPKIKVNANLESVGLSSDGSVGVPVGHNDAAWFNVSPRPGEIGDAIISGHYGVWKNGTPTVFNNLYKLRAGDKIYIKDKTGSVVTFVVNKIGNSNAIILVYEKNNFR